MPTHLDPSHPPANRSSRAAGGSGRALRTIAVLNVCDTKRNCFVQFTWALSLLFVFFVWVGGYDGKYRSRHGRGSIYPYPALDDVWRSRISYRVSALNVPSAAITTSVVRYVARNQVLSSARWLPPPRTRLYFPPNNGRASVRPPYCRRPEPSRPYVAAAAAAAAASVVPAAADSSLTDLSLSERRISQT